MFKTLESKWNSHTPAYLHPYTKENLIWQLKLTGVLLVGVTAWGLYEDHREKKRRKQYRSETTD